MDILESRLFLLVPHEFLQRRQAHVLIRFVGAEGVPEGMDTDLFANPGLFDVFGNQILDCGDVHRRAVFGEEEGVIITVSARYCGSEGNCEGL